MTDDALNSASGSLPEEPGQRSRHRPEQTMHRRLSSAAGWSMLGRVFSVGSLLLSTALLGRSLSKQEFTAYILVAVVVNFSTIFVTFGTTQHLIRAIKRKANVRDALKSCLKIVAVFSLLAAIAVLVGARYLGPEPKWTGLCEHGMWMPVWFALSAICLVAASALQGMDDFRSAALVGARNGGLIPNVLFLACLYVGFHWESLDLGSTIAMRALVQVVTLIFAIRFTAKNVRRHQIAVQQDVADQEGSLQPTTNWFLREGWYSMITQFVVLSLAELDILLVGILVAQDAEIADYGAAKSLISVVRAPLLMAGVIVGPFIAELYYSKQLERLSKLLRGVATLIGIPALLVLTLFLFFPTQIMSMAFGDAFAEAGRLLRVLALGQIVFILTGCKGQTLTMTGHQRELMGCSLLVLVVYGILAPWAIGHWGVVGGAWVNAVLIASLNLFAMIMVQIKVHIWTTPSFSYAALREAVLSIVRRPSG
ncbi:MAG: oligosaccharide flippase family protein [Pirellulales bacterium]|nr:oligosaccharide flippase family protein [Pirellulales bacterium]